MMKAAQLWVSCVDIDIVAASIACLQLSLLGMEQSIRFSNFI
ncbi:hypothetical protein [Xenorhabdus bovienii]|nr:hypothetical protein [Xenorhabdus bovienii]